MSSRTLLASIFHSIRKAESAQVGKRFTLLLPITSLLPTTCTMLHGLQRPCVMLWVWYCAGEIISQQSGIAPPQTEMLNQASDNKTARSHPLSAVNATQSPAPGTIERESIFDFIRDIFSPDDTETAFKEDYDDIIEAAEEYPGNSDISTSYEAEHNSRELVRSGSSLLNWDLVSECDKSVEVDIVRILQTTSNNWNAFSSFSKIKPEDESCQRQRFQEGTGKVRCAWLNPLVAGHTRVGSRSVNINKFYISWLRQTYIGFSKDSSERALYLTCLAKLIAHEFSHTCGHDEPYADKLDDFTYMWYGEKFGADSKYYRNVDTAGAVCDTTK